MTALRQIQVEPFTPESFAPFGIVIGDTSRKSDFQGGVSDAWLLPFDAEGGTQLSYSRFYHQKMRFSVLERHYGVTQGFMPVNGTSLVMVVAPPTPKAGPDRAPKPESLRAFLMDGTKGLLMKEGVWHTLDRYPVRPPHVDVLFLNGKTVQGELLREKADGTKPTRTELVDLKETAGVEFEVTGV